MTMGFFGRRLIGLSIIGLCLLGLPAVADARPQPQQRFSLPGLVHQVINQYFTHPTQPISLSQLGIQPSDLPKALRKPAGVFVTLSQNGKSRACWGSLTPQGKTVADGTIAATLGALTRDYRFRPIRRNEIETLKAQVTVIRGVVPLPPGASPNPLREGILVRQGSRTGVILPGEARDAHYQLVQARLKAGIQPNQPYQRYRILADVYQ